MIRLFKPRIHIIKDQRDAYYSVPFGQVVRNQKHERNIARDHGCEDIGNEKLNLEPKRISYDD